VREKDGVTIEIQTLVDFVAHAHQAWEFDESLGEAQSHFFGKYDNWRDAFELASKAGAVQFH
jgi:hypothetical protein